MMNLIRGIILGFLTLGTASVWILGPSPANGATAPVQSNYLSDVNAEFPAIEKDMELIERPARLDDPTLHDLVFNPELSAEFAFRYKQEFGKTEAEENYFLVNRLGYYQSPTSLMSTQEDARRRDFANYMLKRLAEYHTENILKHDPKFKHVYELKQRISNLNVNVGPQTRLQMQYSFVGNFLDASFENPWAPTFVSVRMDPSAVAPTAPNEIDAYVRRSVTRSIFGEAGFKFYEKAIRIILSKMLRPDFSVSLTQKVNAQGYSDLPEKETLTLLGAHLVF
ncbi:MAG: hypothetical protein IT289_06285 [Oligoflexia bacterium]|nr:hypothetical protein [Oligoflexia bacterium]